jgi:hypothetical protein
VTQRLPQTPSGSAAISGRPANIPAIGSRAQDNQNSCRNSLAPPPGESQQCTGTIGKNIPPIRHAMGHEQGCYAFRDNTPDQPMKTNLPTGRRRTSGSQRGKGFQFKYNGQRRRNQPAIVELPTQKASADKGYANPSVDAISRARNPPKRVIPESVSAHSRATMMNPVAPAMARRNSHRIITLKIMILTHNSCKNRVIRLSSSFNPQDSVKSKTNSRPAGTLAFAPETSVRRDA